MTCREKLKKECPEMITATSTGGCEGCPDNVDYLYRPDYCPLINNRWDDLSSTQREILCTKCWDREIPCTEPATQELDTAPSEPTEQKSSIPRMRDLECLMSKALGYPGIAVSITFMEDVVTFNAYPYPTQEEPEGEDK